MLRIFIIVILFFNIAFGDEFTDAMQQLESKNYKSAVELLKKSAKYGNNEANFELGKIYFKGEGIKRDLNEAVKYFTRASSSGHISAKYNLGVIYANKSYKEFNYLKAFDIFSELSSLGHAASKYKMGIFLLYGLGVDKDYKKAFKWFEEAYFVDKHELSACYLALMYASGKGVFPNFGRARKLSQEGYDKKIPMCVKVYEDFNLQKYDEDKGFKYGFYK